MATQGPLSERDVDAARSRRFQLGVLAVAFVVAVAVAVGAALLVALLRTVTVPG